MWSDSVGGAMASAFHRKQTPTPAATLLGVALLLCAPLALAQEKLGELLDAGAKVLPPEQFKEELVQHLLAGPTASGVALEVVYTGKGLVQGSATGLGVMGPATGGPVPVNGEWKTDENGR